MLASTPVAPVGGANKNGKPVAPVAVTTNDGAITPRDVQEERIGKHAVHPLASLFPSITGDEYTAFVDGIKTGGQQFPIIKDQNGLIVDGRNRLRALVELGIEPKFETKHFENDADLTRFLINANFNRRNLTTVQRAFLAARLQGILRPQALENATRGGAAKNGGGDTRDVAAAQFGVGHTYVDTARKAIEADPKIEQLVKDGTITSMHEVTLRLKDAPGAITYEEIKGLDENRNKRRHALPDEQAPGEQTASEKKKTERVAEKEKRERQKASSEFVCSIVGAWDDEQLTTDGYGNEIGMPPIAELVDAYIAKAYPTPPSTAKERVQRFGEDLETLEKLLKFLPTLIKELKAKLPKGAPVA